MKTILLSLLGVFGLVVSVHAHIGASLSECIQHYGKEMRPSHIVEGIRYHYFIRQGCLIDAGFIQNRIVRIIYANLNKKEITVDEAIGLMRDNGPDLVWHYPDAKGGENDYLWFGYDLNVKGETLADQLVLYASYNLKTFTLVIFTKDGVVNSVDHLY
jgi:hypothetical protein